MKMTESGYEIRKGKYLTFRAPKQKHFTNVKTLGAYYAEDSILRRLEKNRHKARIPQNAPFKVRTFIQMISYVADGNRTGFDQWAKKNNLKEAAKTFSYLSQHNLLNYEEFPCLSPPTPWQLNQQLNPAIHLESKRKTHSLVTNKRRYRIIKILYRRY